MSDVPPQSRLRFHLSWILPLLLVPVIFFVCIFIAGTLYNLGGVIPYWLGVIAHVGAFVGPVVAVYFSFTAIRRRYKGYARQDAARRMMTPEEYGVYKGDVGSLYKPVNSAGGLLVISIILTVLCGIILVLIGVGIAQHAGLLERNPDDELLGPVEWFFVGITFLAPIASWHYYRIERRAQKLRISRGLPRTLR